MRERRGPAGHALVLGALRGIQFAEQLADGGALQPAVEHEIADAHRIRRDDMHAQGTGELARKHLGARGAVDHVMFGGQARQDRRDQIGAGLLGHARRPRQIRAR